MSVEDIANEIRRHNKLYDEGRPEITDTEYDSLVGLMKYIDPDNEVLKEVGAPVSYGKKVKHDIPMGSLEKIKCQLDKDGNPVDGHGAQELEDWVRKIGEVVCFSPKIDGLAGELVYENGLLIQASTRGDGETGQDVTDNVYQITSIPTVIEQKTRIVVRGEFYIPKDSFNALIKEGKIKGDVVNERNVCAGALNAKNPKETGEKCLDFLVYRLWINGQECGDIIDAFNITPQIRGSHFDCPPARLKYVDQIVCGDPKDVKDIVKYMMEQRESYNYRTDGIVVMIKNTAKREALGYVGKNPFSCAKIQSTLPKLRH